MFENFDAETTWLTITNAGLGLVTLICIVAVGYVGIKEYVAHVRQEVRLPVFQDDHSFNLGSLGITMADGGTRIDERNMTTDPHTAVNEDNIIRGDN